MIEMVYSNPYVIFAVILAGTLVAAKVIYFILDKWVRKLTRKTKTDIDDAILDAVEGPVYAVIMVAGAYKAATVLPFFGDYQIYIKNLFFLLAVLAFAWIAQRVVNVVVPRWLVVGKSFEKTPRILSRVINGAIYFIGLLIVLDHLNVAITPLVTTLGIGGIAVGLALQDTLSNFFAGLHIVSDKPVEISDFIQVEGAGATVMGYVEDIGWRSTKIRTLQDNIVIIPNLKLSQSVITNHSLPVPALWFSVKCRVSYETSLEKAEKIALEAAQHVKKHVKGVAKDAEPNVRFSEFDDSNINLNISMQAERFEDKFLIQHELIKEIKKRFDKERIGISYPVRKIITVK